MILAIIPGPTVLLVMSDALADGRRSAWSVAAGVVLGDLTAMSVSLAGLGMILSSSVTVFTVLKWVGAAYLIYLGIRMWLDESQLSALGAVDKAPASKWKMMSRAYTMTTLNPKSIAFFVAFMPQFIIPAATVLPQILLLGGTFLFFALLNAFAYAQLAGGLRHVVLRLGVMRTAN